MSHYYYFKKYELLQIGSVSSIVLKRSSESDDLVYMVPVEGYFEKLLEAHNQTGHGRRDKMLYYMKQQWRIPRSAYAVTCQECDLETHINCGTLADQDTFFCSLCSKEKHIHDVQEDCHSRQKLAVNKMVTFSTEEFPELAAGDCITLAVSTVDRASIDFSRILGVVLDKQNEVYQIGTKAGIMKGWSSRPEIQKSGASMITLLDVRRDNFLTLREAAVAQSKCGGQGYKKCNCKVTKEQCSTKRCSCFKANMKCGSRCHNSNPCANKDC
ncbi:uncharacterized protein LOC124297098 [Neodiprion virginianus]|uniref:uncharacterized protein LOC124297098 n=1 Tax=Neodiprion virginianus TaxID=2961670 RepID=UPI001EE6B810|nr:uncharacterized protein LOC124297098 [Neodiprion virginianus]